MLWSCIIALALLLPSTLRAQSWEPAANESFSAITSAEDGALLLLRSPGDILRSTDSGLTWSVVYRGGAALTGFGRSQDAPTEIYAYADSSEAVVSRDSGRTWRTAPPSSPLLLRFAPQEGELPSVLYPLPAGTKSVGFADSEWWAVGEPGLVCRWDGTKWIEVHRAPFPVDPGTAPSPSPILFRSATEEGESEIAFSSAAHGAIAVGNRIYFTNDSALTWSEYSVPDTASISSFFLLSDTSALLGMLDGHLYYDSNDVLSRCDSILYSSNEFGVESMDTPAVHGILQIGWKDKLDGDLFVLTDSLLYSVRSDLSSATPYALPLAPDERALAASFPDPYTGFLLTDSIRRFDTLASDGQDTTLLFDTSFVYRTLDGGATWNLVLKNIPGLTNMFFENTKIGFVCGTGGLILHTEDTGSHWARAWTMTRQNLHAIDMVNGSSGYAVGDSGVVLLTQIGGRFWRPIPPEPLFTHPVTAYTGIAFPDAHTVYIVARDRCYKARIPTPFYWHPHWHWPVRHTLSISEWPNPTSGEVAFDIRSSSKSSELPSLKIIDVNGSTLSEVSAISITSSSEWSAKPDLSFLPAGDYTAIVTLGAEQAMCKFLIER